MKNYVPAVFLLLLTFGIGPAARADGRPNGAHWVGTWTTAPVPQPPSANYSVGFKDQTLRQIVKVSLGGSELRLRLSNTFGTKKVQVGTVRVGLRDKGPAIKDGSNRAVTFGGATSVTLWPGAVTLSDPIKLDVPALAELAVSIYLPGEVPASLPITYHGIAKQTNYISPSGDHTAQVEMPVEATKLSWYFLTGIDVVAPQGVGAVVALGDSLTDANLSSADTNSRWTDALAAKLHADGVQMGVINQGTGGGRLLSDVVGDGAHGRPRGGIRVHRQEEPARRQRFDIPQSHEP